MINIEYLEKIARAKWREYIDTVIDESGVEYNPNKNKKMPSSIKYNPQSKEFIKYLGTQYGSPTTVYNNWRDAINDSKRIEIGKSRRWLRNRLLAAAGIGATALLGYDMYNQNKKEEFNNNYNK